MRKQTHRQLCCWPRSWWTSIKLSIDNCSCSFHRYERCGPCCGAHGNIRGGQSVLYIWGQCLLPICAFSDSGIWTAHWLRALSSQVSLLLTALAECRKWGRKWDKTAQKSGWYQLPGLDYWVNDPGCVNCVSWCQRIVREMDRQTAAWSFPSLSGGWSHFLVSAHGLTSQWRICGLNGILLVSAQIKMMSWACLEMDATGNHHIK